jgi:hypothetical protein
MRSTWATGGFRTEFAKCGVVLHRSDYGKAVPWTVEKAHRWDIAGFPRIRLTLEAQYTLMKFLRAAGGGDTPIRNNDYADLDMEEEGQLRCPSSIVLSLKRNFLFLVYFNGFYLSVLKPIV